MARWRIEYTEDGQYMTVIFVNMMTGQTFMCGRATITPSTVQDLIDWIVQDAQPTPGDIVTTPTRTYYYHRTHLTEAFVPPPEPGPIVWVASYREKPTA